MFSQQWERCKRQPRCTAYHGSFTSANMRLAEASHMGEPYAFCQGMGQVPIHTGRVLQSYKARVLVQRGNEEWGQQHIVPQSIVHSSFKALKTLQGSDILIFLKQLHCSRVDMQSTVHISCINFDEFDICIYP